MVESVKIHLYRLYDFYKSYDTSTRVRHNISNSQQSNIVTINEDDHGVDGLDDESDTPGTRFKRLCVEENTLEVDNDLDSYLSDKGEVLPQPTWADIHLIAFEKHYKGLQSMKIVITAVLALSNTVWQYRDTSVADRAVYVDRPEDDRVPSPSLTDSDSLTRMGIIRIILSISMLKTMRSILSLQIMMRNAPLIEIIMRSSLLTL
ncbi:unnamed protein product [Citrullus colocynthis]|uniref:PiggyBac transposable element-derived protein domain-containing protein n=1 Tax=Citrullus colocynthis TaxID=252529 RepID=A0ABP0YBL3_9ROSI